MGARIQVYMDPGSPTKSFDLDGPESFSFETKYITGIICGDDPIGKVLFEKLAPEERTMLEPRAHVFEAKLEALNPEVLKKVVIKFYELATQLLMMEEEAESLIRYKFSPVQVFVMLKRDIAGAVFICDMAIEKNKLVYWALG